MNRIQSNDVKYGRIQMTRMRVSRICHDFCECQPGTLKGQKDPVKCSVNSTTFVTCPFPDLPGHVLTHIFQAWDDGPH